MKIYKYVLALLFAVCPLAIAAGQGLKFANSLRPIEERTSYTVFERSEPAFSGSFEIAFDLSLSPDWEIGYLVRIKNRRSDTIYNLFYNSDNGSQLRFRFNEEGRNSLITAEVDRDELYQAQWFQMSILFDMERDVVRLSINGHTFETARLHLPETYYPDIVFGQSDYLIDVPAFAVRNLRVGNDRRSFRFALREHEGETVYDERGRRTGSVRNPEWLINDAYRWRYVTCFASQTGAGANYCSEHKRFYFFNTDTLGVYDIRTGEQTLHRFPERCPVGIALGRNFVDARRNRLYAYEVYYEPHFPPPVDGISVASLDLDNHVWRNESRQLLPLQLYHHSMFHDAATGRYTIFGGFGNMHYSRDFYTFTPDDSRWERIEGLKGDTLFPRYFSSMGYRPEEHAAYVFGGMGNHSGEQIVGRLYFYDLHRVDFDAGRIEKLWQIPWEGPNVVPVRGMVLDGDHFYTLCYPEYRSQSYLRLYRFSLRDGSYEILGDSIPIHSDKITTNANLYYDEQMNRLFATVQEFEANDRTSTMKIYSLAFPPVTAETLAAYPQRRRGRWIALAVAAMFVAAATGGFVLRRRRERRAADDAVAEKDAGDDAGTMQPNSMLLFGSFTVRSRRNRDITYLFSTRLKQMLCLILEYSGDGEGISSQQLSSLLWPGEPKDKVKNLRGVTINHLRKIFSEMDGIELVYQKGFFRIVRHPAFYCDYLRCLEIVAEEEGQGDRDELLRLLARGKFLQGADLPIFDSFKGKVEARLEPLLRLELERSYEAEEYALTLRAAEALFNIDPWNEEALVYRIRAMQRQRRNEEAYLCYRTYVTEYKRVYGTDYPRPYKEL